MSLMMLRKELLKRKRIEEWLIPWLHWLQNRVESTWDLADRSRVSELKPMPVEWLLKQEDKAKVEMERFHFQRRKVTKMPTKKALKKKKRRKEEA